MNPGEVKALSTQVSFNLLLHQPYLGRESRDGILRWLGAKSCPLSESCNPKDPARPTSSPLLYPHPQIFVVSSITNACVHTARVLLLTSCARACRRHVQTSTPTRPKTGAGGSPG